MWGMYPNLGIGEPSPDGIITNYYSNNQFLDNIKSSVNLGATVIGGCCGSSPSHIQLLNDYFSVD